jgi:DNA-binding NtrC family response regulator
VVVLDFESQAVTGIELVSALRESDTPPAIVALLPAGASPVHALRAGAQAVHKPLDLEELHIVIDRVVAHDRLVRENGDLNARLAQLMTNGMPPIPGSRLDELERYAILETLKVTAGSTSKAAEMLGISVRTIQYRLHDYNATPRSQLAVVGTGKTAQR